MKNTITKFETLSYIFAEFFDFLSPDFVAVVVANFLLKIDFAVFAVVNY